MALNQQDSPWKSWYYWNIIHFRAKGRSVLWRVTKHSCSFADKWVSSGLVIIVIIIIIIVIMGRGVLETLWASGLSLKSKLGSTTSSPSPSPSPTPPLELHLIRQADRTRSVDTSWWLYVVSPHRRPAVSLAFYFPSFGFLFLLIFLYFFFGPALRWLTLLYNPVWRVVPGSRSLFFFSLLFTSTLLNPVMCEGQVQQGTGSRDQGVEAHTRIYLRVRGRTVHDPEVQAQKITWFSLIFKGFCRTSIW